MALEMHLLRPMRTTRCRDFSHENQRLILLLLRHILAVSMVVCNDPMCMDYQPKFTTVVEVRTLLMITTVKQIWLG